MSHQDVEYRPLPMSPRYLIGSDGSVIGPSGRVLSGGMSHYGYRQVLIYLPGGGRKIRTVHRLVCETFHGPCPDGHQVAHWDGDKLNNSATNLRWATARENIHDKFRHGRMADRRGELAGTVKLTNAQVLEIRQRCQNGESQRSIAGEYGVRQPAISNIMTGKTWSHIQ